MAYRTNPLLHKGRKNIGVPEMSSYLICYDLDKPGQDYSDLISELEGMSARRIQYSVWLVDSNSSATEVRDTLSRFIDNNDRLFVGRLDGVAAWQNLMISHAIVKQLLAS